MRYLMGKGEIAAMADLILAESGANWPSTMMMPSVPTATVMLPPWPSSIYVLLPRSVVLIWILSQSINGGGGGEGDCCAPAPPANSTADAASKTNAIRFMGVLPDFPLCTTGNRRSPPGGVRP